MLGLEDLLATVRAVITAINPTVSTGFETLKNERLLTRSTTATAATARRGVPHIFDSLQSYRTDPVGLLSTWEHAQLEKLLSDA